MSDRPLFSVVLPCYQVEEYLPEALDQILGQSCDDLELIVVDDASPDGCGDIARAAAERDPRVRVVTHERNLGLAAARNSGMDAARGYYLWMPDPDDRYDPDLLARVALATLEVPGGPDLVLFGCRERYYAQDGTWLYDHEIASRAGLWEGDALHAHVFELERDTLFGYAWNKCYRLDALRAAGLRFVNLRLIEDVSFNAAYAPSVTSLVELDGAPYDYRKQDGRSLTNANAYGAREYWALHQRRIELLVGLARSWGMFDEQRALIGSLYVRYLLSATYRTFLDVDAGIEAWNDTRKGRWLLGIFRSDLFCELVPYAQARDSASLACAIEVARSRNAMAFMSLAHAVYAARKLSSTGFTRARSRR